VVMRHVIRTLTRIGFGLVFAAGTSAAAQTPRSDDRATDAAAIRAHIESIFQAFVDKDRGKLEATHGVNWRGFTPWSEAPIRGLDNYMKSATFPPDLPKSQGMVGYRMSNFDVVFYGDTAVATFVADLDVAYGDTKGTQKLTLLDVYHKEPSGWIQVASNTSLHADELEQMGSQFRKVDDAKRTKILAAREAVWRAWFSGDSGSLARLLPPELITIDGVAGAFGTRDSALTGSRTFASSGAKLTRLAFPRTEFQGYGNTVILYTAYEMDLENRGETRRERGLATEVFVHRHGQWVNTGWQLAPASNR
jgi:Domain of unknown function (DUF4440)